MLTDCQAQETSTDRALLAELAAWLVDASTVQYAPVDRFNGFCTRLTAVIPQSRLSLILETLHPEDSGIRAHWQEGQVDRTEQPRVGIRTSRCYQHRTRKSDDKGISW